MSAPAPHADPADDSGIGPYLMIVAVAVVIGLGLLLFIAGYRNEIMAMVTQSPT